MFSKKRNSRGGGYQGSRPQTQREFSKQTSPSGTQLVNSFFKEPVYQIIDKIKNEPFFKWPNKMGGNSSKRN